ncbi:hypothetical protein G9H60_09400 [Aquirufa sp. 15D-MOB]|nr:hypothetical protein [Aquirufa aurantiipilula]
MEISITIIALAISVSIGLRQYKIENDKIFKELFVMYNDKYDEKFNNHLNHIVYQSQNNPEYRLSEMEQSIVIDYLNICAEEYLWYTKGRIDPTVWKSWESGMKFYLEKKTIKEFIVSESSQKESYYGLFEYLNIGKTA